MGFLLLKVIHFTFLLMIRKVIICLEIPGSTNKPADWEGSVVRSKIYWVLIIQDCLMILD